MKRLLYLLLVLICSNLYAEQVVYTITSSSSVSEEGDLIDGSEASYQKSSTTGGKGQMTKGNYTRLTLTGYDSATLTAVSLMMHSNSKSGAGTLSMTVGDKEVWHISNNSFSKPAWNGEFSTASVTIAYLFEEPILVKANEEIIIYVEATENSLYIDSYIIEFQSPQKLPHFVRFLTGTDDQIEDIWEKSADIGITLPNYSYNDGEWEFMGWTEYPVYESETFVNYYRPMERFFPRKNTYLYALYKTVEDESEKFYNNTLFATDSYLIIQINGSMMAISGVDSKTGKIEAKNMEGYIEADEENNRFVYASDSIKQEAIYDIQFFEDSTLTLYNSKTRSYIGFPKSSSNRLNKQPSRWSWRVLQDSTIAIYHSWDSEHTRYLYAYDSEFECALVVVEHSGFALYRVDDVPLKNIVPTTYTCFAQQQTQPLEDPFDDALEAYQTGVIISTDRVINPANKELQLYNLFGDKVLKTNEDILFNYLPQGWYILLYDKHTHKLFIH